MKRGRCDRNDKNLYGSYQYVVPEAWTIKETDLTRRGSIGLPNKDVKDVKR